MKKSPQISYWSHEIVKKKVKKLTPASSSWVFGVFEVYYDKKDKIVSWSQEPETGWHESEEAVLSHLIYLVTGTSKAYFGKKTLIMVSPDKLVSSLSKKA